MLKQRIGSAFLVTAALAVSLAAASAAPAFAERTGEFKVFEHCPLKNENLAGCLVSRTEAGSITIGKQEVPIVATQTLQGGFEENRKTGALTFVAAEGG